MMAALRTGLRSRVGGDCNIVSMVLDEALTLWFAISGMRRVTRKQLHEDFLTHQVNKTCVCLTITQVL